MNAAAETMKIVQLEADVRARAMQVSQLINLVEQIEVALNDDNPDEALRLIQESR